MQLVSTQSTVLKTRTRDIENHYPAADIVLRVLDLLFQPSQNSLSTRVANILTRVDTLFLQKIIIFFFHLLTLDVLQPVSLFVPQKGWHHPIEQQ